ncbi:hypothetical protein [Roseimicrobium sp. ORNL1]|uniref:hypothetical protein n=1 Tax=Roseimicrobium sp. ORNL1 TaxID=2711231 RepID=UPI0013E19EAD|nr:hypothetical protein [Roseimicrobium sp. ORNL1]QIF00279.1 hypothetical protein G5S37_01640 [Roseimicrobium sp. ORNL1]
MKISLPYFVRGSMSTSGAALIMTVIILAMITIMVLGLADLVRYETASSSAHQERARAQLFARMGVDIVTGVLRKETADPARTWASKPGALIVPDSDGNPPQLTRLGKQVNLHSGLPSPSLLDPGFKPIVLRPADLNIQTFADQNPPTHLITDQPQDPANPASPVVKLPVRWIYVRADGTLDYAESPDLTRASNPLVGRFAYWTDDESSKINLNTAWKRNPAGSAPAGLVVNTFSASHPTSVNVASLKGMTAQMADVLHGTITPNHLYTDLDNPEKPGRFFNSPREVRALGAEFTSVFNAAKFEVTHYNHDPDTTFFNEPRIVLTTQKKHAKGRPFLDILKNPGTDTTLGDDPGYVRKPTSPYNTATSAEVIDRTKFNDVIKKLVTYLKREDWPMVDKTPAGTARISLQSKYFNNNSSRLAQLALGIVEYVRSAESSKTLVEPIRVFNTGTDSAPFYYLVTTGDHTGKDDTYKGNPRGPHITEMAIWRSNTATSGRYRVRYYIEIYLPENYGIDSIDLLAPETGKQMYLYQHFSDQLYASATATTNAYEQNGKSKWFKITNAPTAAGTTVPTMILGGGSVMNPGDYRTIVMEFYRSGTTTTFPMRHALAMGDSPTNANNAIRLDIAPLGDVGNDKAITLNFVAQTNVSAEALETIPSNLSSIESDDPRVNAVAQDWKLQSGTNTLAGGIVNAGGRLKNNNNKVGQGSSVPTDQPEQDLDINGKISSASLRMPYPRGHTKNPAGVVYSPGELGLIQTGLEGKSRTGGAGTPAAATGGIPWRTLRLQPNRYRDSNVVPDWAFMDLFTVPVEVPALAKGIFSPHDTTTAGRINMNAQTQPFGNPELFATPLERRMPLVALLAGVPKDGSGTLLKVEEAEAIARNIYFRTLSLAQGKVYGHASTYDSPGEVVEIEGVADKGEESEAVVRGIANLICARGSVFNVYTIGQSLKQTRNGELLVTAEQRQQTLIERYDRNTNPNITDIYFRKAGFQHLNP